MKMAEDKKREIHNAPKDEPEEPRPLDGEGPGEGEGDGNNDPGGAPKRGGTHDPKDGGGNG
jgi:hypothetical protein